MNTIFVASWRPGAEKFYKANAQKIAEEVCALGENPKTEEILNMARNTDTEFHKVIEWDDSVAAEKYRCEQVRQVMQDLQIVEIGLNEKKPEKLKVPLRMFYHLNEEEGYRPTPVIMKDEDLHAKLLMTAKSELMTFYKKYSNLCELKPVMDAIESINNMAS